MILVPFFEIPYREKLAKNVNSQYVQVIPRSTTYFTKGQKWPILKSNFNSRDGFMVPNEKARFDDLKQYTGNDIIITLPKGTSMFDVNYLAIYNDQTGDNLGHIQFDIRSNKIPPALGQTKKPGWWFEVPTTRY